MKFKIFIRVLFIVGILLWTDEVVLAATDSGLSTTTASDLLEVEDPLEDMTILYKYNVSNGLISNGKKEAANSEYASYQNNTSMHQQIWSLFAKLFPAEKIVHVTNFYIATDGEELTVASISKNDTNNGLVLAVDPLDFYDSKGKLTEPELLFETFVHEFGHIISLGPDQIDYTIEDEESCLGVYLEFWGCPKRGSVMIEFFNKFWVDGHMAYDYINLPDGDDVAGAKYYSEYRKVFINGYAASDVFEDFSEIFSDHVINDYYCALKNRDKTTFCHKRKYFEGNKALNKLKPGIVAKINQAYVDLGIEKPNLTVEEKIEKYRELVDEDSTLSDKIMARAYVTNIIDNALKDKKIPGKDKILYKNFYKEVRNWR